MRMIIGVLVSLALFVSPAAAATKYVDDLHEITVRVGPGINYRVIKTVSSGTQFETLDNQNGWTQVRLEAGGKGWVVSRYLTDGIPDSKKYETLKAKYDPLAEQIEALKTANKALNEKNQALSKQLAEASEALAKTQANYEELKKASTNVVKLKTEHDQLASELKEKKQEVEALEAKIADAFLSEALKWFLAGAGVLVLGIIIGSSGKRKRSSLL